MVDVKLKGIFNPMVFIYRGGHYRKTDRLPRLKAMELKRMAKHMSISQVKRYINANRTALTKRLGE